MTVQPTLVGGADRSVLGSAALASGRIDAVSAQVRRGPRPGARGHRHRRRACPAWAKALYMAAAAAVKGHRDMLMAQMERSHRLGLTLSDARGAALTVLISPRRAPSTPRLNAAIDEVFGDTMAPPAGDAPEFPIDRQGCLDYFEDYFGFVPDYVRLMADDAPRALEGYVLMREWSLAENVLDATHAELLLLTINAAEFSARFVNVHANGARRAGCSEAQIIEAVVCAIPVAGVASWLPGADGIMEGRS